VGALNRSLAVMVGGDPADFDRARPVFESYGNPVRLVGPVGSGQTLKLLNNLLAFANIRLAADVINLARQFDLDQEAVIDVLRAGGARSFGLEVFLQLNSADLGKNFFQALASERGVPGALEHAQKASAKDISLFQPWPGNEGFRSPRSNSPVGRWST
jgi:3-hydroxyisobutyrate dehydrogenase-like beta-hydroxyacid dehydrogenase